MRLRFISLFLTILFKFTLPIFVNSLDKYSKYVIFSCNFFIKEKVNFTTFKFFFIQNKIILFQIGSCVLIFHITSCLPIFFSSILNRDFTKVTIFFFSENNYFLVKKKIKLNNKITAGKVK